MAFDLQILHIWRVDFNQDHDWYEGQVHRPKFKAAGWNNSNSHDIIASAVRMVNVHNDGCLCRMTERRKFALNKSAEVVVATLSGGFF